MHRRGGRIILACRSKERGERACEEVCRESASQNVVFRQLDLASCKSIRNFAERILAEEREINILINNAGIFFVPYQLTEDGFESHFGINHLGHFLLTHLLLERIKESAPSRIINVSSLGHFSGTLNFDDMMWKKGYSGGTAYTRSKLANVMFSRELAKRLSGTDVTVYSLHPGVIHTEIGRHFFPWYLSPLYVSLMYTHTHTHTNTLTYKQHCIPHTLHACYPSLCSLLPSLSLLFSHTCTHIYTHTHFSFSLCRTHAHAHIHKHTHTHTHYNHCIRC